MEIISRENNSITLLDGQNRYQIFGISDCCIRCVYTRREAFSDASPVEILPQKGQALQADVMENQVRLTAGKLTLTATKGSRGFTWQRSDTGKLLFREADKTLKDIPIMVYTTGGEEPIIKWVKTVDGNRSFVENLRPEKDHDGYESTISFAFQDGEHIHGLGQGEDGIYDYRGKKQYLYQHNMRIPMPFFLSDRGYAVFVNCGSLMTFDDSEGKGLLQLDAVEQLDYCVICGESVDEIISTYRDLTGRTALLPRWAFGYVQSKERYKTQEELLSVATEYRRRGLGLDCIVQDWKTWPGDNWGYKTPDAARYPDLQKMQDTLHDLNVHSMVSVWPNVNSGTADWQEMMDAGFLLHDLATYDAFNEQARELYWKHAKRGLFQPGFDSWWCDSTEPFPGPDWCGAEKRSEEERFRLVGNEHKKFLGPLRANLYAVAHAKGIFENQRKSAPNQRVLNLTRAGYSSIQRYGTVLWSGDISARWDVLRKQITEGLNMGLSGIPFWTLDIGGFFTVHEKWHNRGCECDNDPNMKWFWHGDYEEGVRDLGYRELYVRWFQFGAFLPMFRSHGTDTPREVWQFGNPGEPFYDALTDAIALRYRLLPYIYSLAGRVFTEHGTMMRSLLFDFPKDPQAAKTDDEYMFGDNLLICPVTSPMYYEKNNAPLPEDTPKTRICYLPAGTAWYDFYTGQRYEGGSTVEAAAPLSKIPVYVKAGSITPMEQGKTYADEVVTSPLELHICPSADGKFLYYEDDGNSYEYENGHFQQIAMEWHDAESTLTVGPCKEAFAGGIKGRTLRCIKGETTIDVHYDGKALKVHFPR